MKKGGFFSSIQTLKNETGELPPRVKLEDNEKVGVTLNSNP